MLLATLLLPLGAPHTTYSHLTNAHPSARRRALRPLRRCQTTSTTPTSPKRLGHKFDYNWTAGFIGSRDVAPPSTTISDGVVHAIAACRCHVRGLQLDDREGQIYFKISGGRQLAGLVGVTKFAPVTPPTKTLAVGGSSNRELLLRADYFSVQNLARRRQLVVHEAAARRCRCARTSATSRCASGRRRRRRHRVRHVLDHRARGVGGANRRGDGRARAGRRTVLAAQDVSAALSAGAQRLGAWATVVRSYERSADGAALILRFNISNPAAKGAAELGAVGLALPESPGHPPAGIESVVWNDPHVGGDHGFVEFVRVVDDEATSSTPADGGSARARARGVASDARGIGRWRLVRVGGGVGGVGGRAGAEHAVAVPQDERPLKTLYPPFATDPQTPWPATDGKRSMPLLTADGGGAAPWNPPTSLTLAPGATHLRRLAAAGCGRLRRATRHSHQWAAPPARRSC